MKIKKLIAIDLDGTLLNPEGALSSYSAEFFSYLNEHGYMVVLASGRPFRCIKDHYERCHCYGPAICYNGALAFSPTDPSFPKYEVPFPKDAIKELYQSIKDSTSESFMCESLDSVYITKEDPYLSSFFSYDGMKMVKGDIDKILDVNPMTCLFLPKEEDETSIIEKTKKYYDIGIRYRHWTNDIYSELYMEGGTKGKAIEYVANTLGVDREDIIAIGDSHNDHSMLRYVGKAFCMRNSTDDFLRNNFELTKKGNDEDGAALAIKEYLGL